MNNDLSMNLPAGNAGAKSRWLMYALITTVTWGVWGVFAGLPAEHGFPETLNYVVWCLPMIPPAWIALHRAGVRLQTDRRSVVLGLAAGLLGAGGQLVLFYDVRIGPTYLIFPIIALSPALTIALSFSLLGERTGKLGILGVVLALASLPLFDYGNGGTVQPYALPAPANAFSTAYLPFAAAAYSAATALGWSSAAPIPRLRSMRSPRECAPPRSHCTCARRTSSTTRCPRSSTACAWVRTSSTRAATGRPR